MTDNWVYTCPYSQNKSLLRNLKMYGNFLWCFLFPLSLCFHKILKDLVPVRNFNLCRSITNSFSLIYSRRSRWISSFIDVFPLARIVMPLGDLFAFMASFFLKMTGVSMRVLFFVFLNYFHLQFHSKCYRAASPRWWGDSAVAGHGRGSP